MKLFFAYCIFISSSFLHKTGYMFFIHYKQHDAAQNSNIIILKYSDNQKTLEKEDDF